jgi:hypothetical protein
LAHKMQSLQHGSITLSTTFAFFDTYISCQSKFFPDRPDHRYFAFSGLLSRLLCNHLWLPPGFIFNTTTGVFTGTPTALTTVPAVLEVTATFVDSTTSVCQVTLNVIDFPPSATASNRASATGLNDNKQLAETRFLESAEMIVNNSNLLGLFHAYLELPDYVTFRFAWFYFSRLNYTVVDLNPSNNNAEFSSFFGEYPSFPGLVTPGFENYNDFTQYPASVKSRPARRIRLSWSQFSGYPCSFPWLPYYPIPFNGV